MTFRALLLTALLAVSAGVWAQNPPGAYVSGNSGSGSGLPAGCVGAANPLIQCTQGANGNDTYSAVRFTDSAPTGTYLNFLNAAKTATVYKVDVTGATFSYQGNGGGALSIPSIIGGKGSLAGPGVGNEGLSPNTDFLFHYFIDGVDLGPQSVYQDLGGASGTTYTSAAPIAAYQKGQRFCFDPITTNTSTAPTLNVNSLGAITITKYGGSTLAAGDLLLGHEHCVEYNGTTMDLLTLPANPPSAMFVFSENSASTPSGTQFESIDVSSGPTGTENLVQIPAARAGKITALYVRMTAAEGAAATLAFTVQSCTPSSGACTGSASAITCTVPNNGFTCNDTAHTLTFAAGDFLDVKIVQTGTGTNNFIMTSVAYQ